MIRLFKNHIINFLYKTSSQISIFLSIIVLASFFWWQIKFPTSKIKIDSTENSIIPVLQIEEANYKGTTKSGDKFSISAKTIKENSKKFNVLDLINPIAIINFENGSITLSSNKGEFDFNHGKIELNDNVSFSDKNLNLKLISDNLNGNFNNGEFYSISPVRITFPSGEITSDNCSFIEKEKRLLFSGVTKLFLLK